MLIEKGRLKLDIPVHVWRQDLLSAGLREVAVDGGIGITAATLEDFHGDPADRLITSTALVRGDRLLTCNGRMPGDSGQVGALSLRDVRGPTAARRQGRST